MAPPASVNILAESAAHATRVFEGFAVHTLRVSAASFAAPRSRSAKTSSGSPPASFAASTALPLHAVTAALSATASPVATTPLLHVSHLTAAALRAPSCSAARAASASARPKLSGLVVNGESWAHSTYAVSSFVRVAVRAAVGPPSFFVRHVLAEAATRATLPAMDAPSDAVTSAALVPLGETMVHAAAALSLHTCFCASVRRVVAAAEPAAAADATRFCVSLTHALYVPPAVFSAVYSWLRTQSVSDPPPFLKSAFAGPEQTVSAAASRAGEIFASDVASSGLSSSPAFLVAFFRLFVRHADSVEHAFSAAPVVFRTAMSDASPPDIFFMRISYCLSHTTPAFVTSASVAVSHVFGSSPFSMHVVYLSAPCMSVAFFVSAANDARSPPTANGPLAAFSQTVAIANSCASVGSASHVYPALSNALSKHVAWPSTASLACSAASAASNSARFPPDLACARAALILHACLALSISTSKSFVSGLDMSTAVQSVALVSCAIFTHPFIWPAAADAAPSATMSSTAAGDAPVMRAARSRCVAHLPSISSICFWVTAPVHVHIFIKLTLIGALPSDPVGPWQSSPTVSSAHVPSYEYFAVANSVSKHRPPVSATVPLAAFVLSAS